MSDNIRPFKPGRMVEDGNRPDTSTADATAMLEDIVSGKLSVSYGVLVYVDKKGDFSYHRIGTPSVVEAHGLLHMGHMQIDKANE